MTLKALMQRGGLRRVANANPANAANHGVDKAGTLARLATLALAEGQKAANDNTDPLSNPAAEARRQRVLAMLAERPGIRYALLTDTDAEAVILALAIRGVGTCELRIPRDKYDGPLLFNLIERHGGTVH